MIWRDTAVSPGLGDGRTPRTFSLTREAVVPILRGAEDLRDDPDQSTAAAALLVVGAEGAEVVDARGQPDTQLVVQSLHPAHQHGHSGRVVDGVGVLTVDISTFHCLGWDSVQENP